MPIIEVHLMEGRTVDQKHRAAAAITDAVVESLGVKPESVRILITDLDRDGFYVGGVAPMGTKTKASDNQEQPA